jgi:hypothetical protein
VEKCTGQRIFFGHSIARANLDGTAVETLITGLADPLGIALQIDGAPIPDTNTWLPVGTGLSEVARRDGLQV